MTAPGHRFGASSTRNPFRDAFLAKMDAPHGIEFELPISRPTDVFFDFAGTAVADVFQFGSIFSFAFVDTNRSQG